MLKYGLIDLSVNEKKTIFTQEPSFVPNKTKILRERFSKNLFDKFRVLLNNLFNKFIGEFEIKSQQNILGFKFYLSFDKY